MIAPPFNEYWKGATPPAAVTMIVPSCRFGQLAALLTAVTPNAEELM
jgi:hypothetical protein